MQAGQKTTIDESNFLMVAIAAQNNDGRKLETKTSHERYDEARTISLRTPPRSLSNDK